MEAEGGAMYIKQSTITARGKTYTRCEFESFDDLEAILRQRNSGLHRRAVEGDRQGADLGKGGQTIMKEAMECVAFVALMGLIIMVMLVMPDAW
jgi:hypothetical protein